MQRIYRWMEKLIDRNDRRIGLKTRSEAMSELAQTYLELEHMKLDLKPIPDAVLELLGRLFSENFHESTTKRPNLDIAQQEEELQRYLDIAIRTGIRSTELLEMDGVELHHHVVTHLIREKVLITQLRSNVDRSDRIPLLVSVSDAAESVGL